MDGSIIVCVDGVQEGAKHTAMRGASAEHQSEGVELTHLHSLWSISLIHEPRWEERFRSCSFSTRMLGMMVRYNQQTTS